MGLTSGLGSGLGILIFCGSNLISGAWWVAAVGARRDLYLGGGGGDWWVTISTVSSYLCSQNLLGCCSNVEQQGKNSP